MNTAAQVLPSIADFKTGSEFIARLPLANPQAALRDINLILDSLLAAPPDLQSYFRLLEHLRLPIVFVTEELSRSYLGRQIPLNENEDALFRQVVLLQLKSSRSYAHCAERSSTATGAFDERSLATLLHRCIHFTGSAILEHFRARREVPWGLWLDLHGYYGTSEDLELATLAVPDIMETQTLETHCTAAYLSFVLCDMAGSYSLGLREQTLLYRWARAWSPLVGLYAVSPGEMLPPFVIDLMQDVALRRTADCLHTDQIRRIDTSRLAMQITHVRQQLRQRITPFQLGLGEDCTVPQCLRLLEVLARQWSHARAARKFRRRQASGTIRACTGFEEMHYFISGQEFQQPDSVHAYSREDFDALFAFRFQDDPKQALQIRHERLKANYAIDSWEVVNQSANGFRLMRSASGRKMMHGQLFALCPPDSVHFLLAQAVWLMQETKGGLIAGVRVLPGLPVAISARQVEPDGEPREPYQRAFLMPQLPPDSKEETLIVPNGWFRPGAIVDMHTDKTYRVRLKEVLDSGPDFERISFVACF